MIVTKILFILSAFIIFFAMIGYPILLILLDKVLKRPNIKKDYSYEPTITVMVVAHNEEKVIKKKLENLIKINYPINKYEIVVTSDFSTDKTNDIVEKFIKNNKKNRIKLHKTVNHRGKTNAQNEAQKSIKSEILIMTDANCYFDRNAVKEIVACFNDSSVGYVCGTTVYINKDENNTADSENTYWDLDSKCRDIESRIQTITAGDGNLYACRTHEYKDVSLIECHDSSFPVLFALDKKRALFDPKAKAYEKAGESDKDEYKRKVRMNRNILHNILPSIKILNIFKYKWFPIFYFGHRTCRYLLWLAHIVLIISNIILSIYIGYFWIIILGIQLLFYIISVIAGIYKTNNKLLKMMSYYTMTICAQINGVLNIILGRNKPVWTKAESTR